MIVQLVEQSPTDGMFLDACLTHSQSIRDSQWPVTSIEGETIQETVGIWYYGREGNSKVMDEDQFPCNPSCTPDMTQPDSSPSDKNTQPDGDEDI